MPKFYHEKMPSKVGGESSNTHDTILPYKQYKHFAIMHIQRTIIFPAELKLTFCCLLKSLNWK